jgi:tetratricopeptide (TPR) repeat protein
MAKDTKNQLKKSKVWLANKIKLIRRTSKPMAARAGRWGGPSGVALILFLIIASWLYPQQESQRLKWQLLNNPQDVKTQLRLAEIFLENHQFNEAEKILLLAESNQKNNPQVLGETTNLNLASLKQQKNLSDPQDIKKLISLWEKIVAEKPDYRDGYLQLAILNYKIWQNEKAQEYLKKALIVDPNFGPALELEKVISLP